MLGMGQKGALQWAALPTGISMVERWMEADGVVDTQRFSSETSQSSEPWHKRGRSVPRAVIQRLPTRWGTADTYLSCSLSQGSTFHLPQLWEAVWSLNHSREGPSKLHEMPPHSQPCLCTSHPLVKRCYCHTTHLTLPPITTLLPAEGPGGAQAAHAQGCPSVPPCCPHPGTLSPCPLPAPPRLLHEGRV